MKERERKEWTGKTEKKSGGEKRKRENKQTKISSHRLRSAVGQKDRRIGWILGWINPFP